MQAWYDGQHRHRRCYNDRQGKASCCGAASWRKPFVRVPQHLFSMHALQRPTFQQQHRESCCQPRTRTFRGAMDFIWSCLGQDRLWATLLESNPCPPRDSARDSNQNAGRRHWSSSDAGLASRVTKGFRQARVNDKTGGPAHLPASDLTSLGDAGLEGL